MQRGARVKVDGIVLGYKELELLKELADGRERVLWQFMLDKNPSNYYSGILYARIMKLNEKGLILISANGPKGGKTLRITEKGLEVLRKLKA
jgi:DNA-binding PadR family transcriptional regulator